MSTVFRLRVLNVCYFSLFALFLSFLPVYGSGIGISDTQLGLLLSAGSLISLVSQPSWGVVSDRFRTILKVLLPLMAAGTAAGALLYQSEQAWSYALGVGLMYVFFLPTDPLMESLNYQTSQRLGVPFGSIRMFGALGYAIASLAAGYASDLWGMHSLSWVFAGCGIAAVLLGLTVPDVRTSAKAPAFRQLFAFFGQSRAWTFLLLVLVVAVAHKMNDLFLGLRIERLGGSMRLTGTAWFVMTIAETLFFALSSRWVKLGREGAVMTLAAAMYAVRFLLCGFVSSPYALAALQAMQGVTFVLFYVGGIQYIHAIAPAQWRSTGQTAFTSVFFGVSGIVGSALGGWLMDEYGGAALYYTMAGIAAAGCLLFRMFLFPRGRQA
ncbi:MFS transporter [Cohnella candidum]|uniref:MFS transporter n=1 Tax=Cohnella candidum TaxID=2674991 RepID=A0A3G3JSN2_9BACL|nr:MFS transporter [Cohnella candidum]AYQ71202.1 MFS transporter [Cohnella candidum]